MYVNLIKENWLRSEGWQLVCLFLVILIYIPINGQGQFDYRFSLLSILVTFLLVRNRKLISLSFYDGVFILPAGLAFMSMAWARNPDLAFDMGMNWLLIYFLFLLGRSMKKVIQENLNSLVIVLAGVIFCSLLISGFWILFNGMDFSKWQNAFGFNQNHVASLQLCLLPLLFLGSWRVSLKHPIVVLALAVGLLMLVLNALLARVLILILGLALVSTSGFSKRISWRRSVFVCIGVSLLLGCIVYFDVAGARYDIRNLFDQHVVSNRTKLFFHSIELMKSNHFLGVGAGNWIAEYGQFGLDQFSTLRRYIGFREYHHAHSFISTFIAEFGILGIFVLGGFVYLAYTVVIGHQSRNRAVLLTYFIITFIVFGFYGISYFSLFGYPSHFFLFAFMIGGLANGERKARFRHLSTWIIVLTALVSCWFVYENIVHVRFSKRSKQNMDGMQLSSWMIPNVKEHVSRTPELELLLDMPSTSADRRDVAYRKLLDKYPYRASYHTAYAEYLLSTGRIKEAVSVATHSWSTIQENGMTGAVIGASLSKMGDCYEANKWLEKCDKRLSRFNSKKLSNRKFRQTYESVTILLKDVRDKCDGREN